MRCLKNLGVYGKVSGYMIQGHDGSALCAHDLPCPEHGIPEVDPCLDMAEAMQAKDSTSLCHSVILKMVATNPAAMQSVMDHLEQRRRATDGGPESVVYSAISVLICDIVKMRVEEMEADE